MSDTLNSKDQRGLLSLASWKEAGEERRPGLAEMLRARGRAYDDASAQPQMSPLLTGLAQRLQDEPREPAGPSVADLLRRRGEELARSPRTPAAAMPAVPEIPSPRRTDRPMSNRPSPSHREADAPAGEDTRSILRRAARHPADAAPARADMPAPRAGKMEPKPVEQKRGIFGRIAGLMRGKPKADAPVADARPPHAQQPVRENPRAALHPRISDIIAQKTPQEPRLPEAREAAAVRPLTPAQPAPAPRPPAAAAQPPVVTQPVVAQPQPVAAPPAVSAPQPVHQYAPPPAAMPHAPAIYPAAAMLAAPPVMPFPPAAPAYYPAMPGPMPHPASAHFYWPQPAMPQPVYYAPPPSAAWPPPMPGAASQMPVEAVQPQAAPAAEAPVRPSAANDAPPQPAPAEMPAPPRRHDPLTAEIDDVREQLRAFGDSLRALHRTRASRQIG